MHTIKPAVLKPGVRPDELPGPRPGDTAAAGPPRLVRGTALIFWDPKLPGTKFGRKLDAIDTDQITPAADCVSESLETLDERWKAGSFRYLMPDFRARVHRGETFVIAGDRFAIGSSREMSPAGLKGIAEEAGLEMVIICGQNMGDIFRRNAFNLGLHVVQSPEAVADARDGDEFTFDPASRRVENVTQGRSYDPVPLSPKEDEIRRSGGIFALGRREFRASVERPPVVAAPPPAPNAPLSLEPRVGNNQVTGLIVAPGGDGGAAYRAAGFQPGDVIVAVNGQRVTGADQALTLFRQSGGNVTLMVDRGGRAVPVRMRVNP